MTDFDRDHAEILATWGVRLVSGWHRQGVVTILGNVRGRNAHDVAMAWIRFCAEAAERVDTHDPRGPLTPGAFPNLSGPHWSEKVAPPATPSPPKPHEACKECGRALHAADRVCDRPTVRPLASVPPSVAYLNLRRPSGRQTTPEQGA